MLRNYSPELNSVMLAGVITTAPCFDRNAAPCLLRSLT